MARGMEVGRRAYGFGAKRKAYMQVILSIIEHNDANTISLTKSKITDMMRAITDYCGNNKYLYQNPKRSQKAYKYSDDAWALRDKEKNQGLVGDHCVPLNSIFAYLVKEKQNSTFSRDEIEHFLDYHLEVVMITKEEDKILNDNGLKSKMPNDWDFFEDKYARYKISGINIALESVLNSLENHT